MTLMAKYNPSGRVTDGPNFYGFAKAHTFVRAMYKAGKNPTRAGLMRALLSFNETSPYLLPGVDGSRRRRPTTSSSRTSG